MDKPSFAQWARDHGTPLDSLDLRAALDDLEPLRELVGDARVVALGESSHHVREFYQARHRMARFLIERCGFEVYALEAPFTEGHVLDDWVRGGPGAVEDVAGTGITMSLGDCPEMHEFLAWLRTWNDTGPARPVRCAGTDVPTSGWSPLPALDAVAGYLRRADPDALPDLERARAVAERFHHVAIAESLTRYPSLADGERDALTAALSHLLARLERLAARARERGEHAGHATAAHHLRGAWHLDHLHRESARSGFERAATFRDSFIAESVLRLLADSPKRRVLLAAHNWHIQRTPFHAEDGELLPAGYHLARALGDDFRAVAVTAGQGRTSVSQQTGEHPRGFVFRGAPLGPPAEGSVEAALPFKGPLWTLTDLRAARDAVGDATSVRRTRMADYFIDVPVLDAFDAIACVPSTTSTDDAR